MPYADREARLTYLREYQALNPDVRDRHSDNTGRRTRGREFVRALKDAPCVDCGGRFHHSAMEFDHRPDEAKTWDLNRLVVRKASIATLTAEIAKCDLVCANCHRLRTWKRSHDEGGRPLPGSGTSIVSLENARAARARRQKAKNRKAQSVAEARRG